MKKRHASIQFVCWYLWRLVTLLLRLCSYLSDLPRISNCVMCWFLFQSLAVLVCIVWVLGLPDKRTVTMTGTSEHQEQQQFKRHERQSNLWSSSWPLCTKQTLTCLLHMHLPIYCPVYVHMALGNCKNFCDFNFANLHGFAKFSKITSHEILYVYGMYCDANQIQIVFW